MTFILHKLLLSIETNLAQKMFGRTGQFIDGNQDWKAGAFTVCIGRNPVNMKRLIKRENFRQKQKAYEKLPVLAFTRTTKIFLYQ